MSSLKGNKACVLLEQYLSYLTWEKPFTAEEYRVDCNMLFKYSKRKRGVPQERLFNNNF